LYSYELLRQIICQQLWGFIFVVSAFSVAGKSYIWQRHWRRRHRRRRRRRRRRWRQKLENINDLG
jgi:hypothetical protein